MRFLPLLLLFMACAGTPIEPYAFFPPNLGAATDGNVTVLVAQGEGQAGVRLLPASETSIHLLGPVRPEAGKVIVIRRKPVKERLVLDKGQALPSWCRHLFTDAEAAALQLEFREEP